MTLVDRAWLRAHSELGISALLLGAGLLVLVDTIVETRGGGSDPVAMLAGVLVATAVLIPILGWPIAGFVLFWGSTYALGSRQFPRDPLIAAGVSLVTWFVFDSLLGVDLPGGPLMGLAQMGLI